MTDKRAGDAMGGDGAGDDPLRCRIDVPEAATAEEVELDVEFALDMADAATEEALLP